MPDHGQPSSTRAAARSFLTNDVRFTIPGVWEDRSVIVLLAPAAAGDEGAAGGAAAFSVTLHRDAPQPGEDLDAYVARQMAQLEAGITDLDVLREGTRTVGGLPAREAEFRWTDVRGRLRQHQVHVLRDGPDGPCVLTWTATGLAMGYLNYADDFAALLESVRLMAPAVVAVIPGPVPGPAAP